MSAQPCANHSRPKSAPSAGRVARTTLEENRRLPSRLHGGSACGRAATVPSRGKELPCYKDFSFSPRMRGEGARRADEGLRGVATTSWTLAATCLLRRSEAPHPALRATFSPPSRGEGKTVAAERHPSARTRDRGTAGSASGVRPASRRRLSPDSPGFRATKKAGGSLRRPFAFVVQAQAAMSSIRPRFWTAAPDAPLPRLSRRADRTTW